MRRLDIITCPVAENFKLAIRIFTLEVEGSRETAKLHNGATMLVNLLDIWKLGLGENTDGFSNKVYVMSSEFTAQTIQLSCYSARKKDRGIEFYGRVLYGWHLYDGKGYKQAHRYTRNALKWVCPALSALEDKLNTDLLPPTTPRTPPNQATGKRTRSLTSGSSSASTPVKKKGVTKSRKALSGGKGEACEGQASEDEAEPLSEKFSGVTAVVKGKSVS